MGDSISSILPLMPPPDLQTLNLILFSLAAALYLPLIVNTLARRGGQEGAAYLVCLYALVGMALGVAEALWRGGRLPNLDASAYQNLQTYGAAALSFVMLLGVLAFLRRDLTAWLGSGAIWGLVLAVILSNLLALPEVVWSSGGRVLPRERLGLVWALLGWLVFVIAAIVSVRSAYLRSRQPLFRNRLTYWLPAFFFITLNDYLLLAGIPLQGNLLRLAAAIVMSYTIVTHDLPDLRQIARGVLVYVITTLLIVAFYVAGFAFSQVAFRAAPNFNPLLIGAIIALLLALLFTPLLAAIRRLVERWLRVEQFDPGRTLQEYAGSISTILDMQRLASVAVGLIIEAMNIARGFLFLVDTEMAADGRRTYRLRAVRSPGERQIKMLSLAEDSPVAACLTRESRPLLQYDLDLLPAFRTLSPHEREWFSRLEAEVYLPILAKNEWIGMLALGAKLSGSRYTDADLVTLSALANQTAVALENARLVEDLIRVNQEFRQARRDLERINRDLERLDHTKSDFISIISHELRTPLTAIRGYAEMLLEDENLPAAMRETLTGIHKSALRLHEIMDAMFDIALLDARALQLHLQSVSLNAILAEVCAELRKTAEGRGQSLILDLPALPPVSADPDGLRKVFDHLVTNAIKFTPNGGRITILGRTVPPRQAEMPHGGVEIVVSDTGVGVDPTLREVIFSKFYQPGELVRHSTSKTRFLGGGAGLGLALSKGIVEAHGGRIWVESPGYDEVSFPGSHFHVLLPLARAEKREEAEAGGSGGKAPEISDR